MTESNSKAAMGTDWTGLLADPDLARNLGKLLQTYRDAAPESRDAALLTAMQEIKRETGGPTEQSKPNQHPNRPVPVETTFTPPFEPDVFDADWAQDRRQHPRIKCFVAVELRVDESEKTNLGQSLEHEPRGCQVETAAQISGGSKVEIGLWVASGKIWVKGVALNGVVTRSAPSGGVRVRFAGLEAAGKENLRQFLKYIQETTRVSRSEGHYLQLLK